jgi:hypothetical protein
MTSKSSGAPAHFNLPLALLWLVAVVAGVAGYLILTSSNASQAAFYAKQSTDYGTYFQAQSGSFLGSILIGAGVIGVIIALASHVRQRPVAVAPAEPEFSDEELFVNATEDETDAAFDVHNAAIKAATDAPATSAGTNASTGAAADAGVAAGVAPTTAR